MFSSPFPPVCMTVSTYVFSLSALTVSSNSGPCCLQSRCRVALGRKGLPSASKGTRVNLKCFSVLLMWNKNLNAFLSSSFTPIYVSKEQICGHTHSNHYVPEKRLQRGTSKHAIFDADRQRLGLSTSVKHHANFRCNRTALCFTTGLCSMLNTRFPDEL